MVFCSGWSFQQRRVSTVVSNVARKSRESRESYLVNATSIRQM
jgi:hypothetical protein